MSVDSRILEMVFNNKKFEDGVNESIDSLKDLDKSINGLEKNKGSASLDAFGVVAEKVGDKFSALRVVATGALLKIGEQAVLEGERLVKSLSLDQIQAGWQKFGEKTTSMATILNNAHKADGTAYSLEEVNTQLDKLNWFTDETSYNFTDMVNNIGKFTSQGKNLEDSVEAMEGISVWASAAGQGVNEASRAMYNLSQAMGVGALKLQDWKSIQNANMATEEFKQLAIQEGLALGSLEKYEEVDEKTGKTVEKFRTVLGKTTVSVQNFDQTLSEGWLDSNVLMDTLKEYGKFATKLSDTVDNTGIEATALLGILDSDEYLNAGDKMAYLNDYIKENEIVFESAEYTVEDFAAALDTLNSDEYELSKRAFKAAQEAKTFEEAINATKDAVSTGFMNIFEQFFGNYYEAKELWSELAERLYAAFTPAVDGILNVMKQWRKLDAELGGRTTLFGGKVFDKETNELLYESDGAIWKIWDAFDNISKKIGEAWQKIFPSSLDSKVKSFQNLIIKIDEMADAFLKWTEESDTITTIFQGIFSILSIGKKIITGAIDGFNHLFEILVGRSGETLFETIVEPIEGVANFVTGINQKLEESNGIHNFFIKLADIVGKLLKPVQDVVSWIGRLTNVLKRALTWDDAMGQFEYGMSSVGKTAKVLIKVFNGIKAIISGVVNGIKNFVNTLKGINEVKTDKLIDTTSVFSTMKKVADKCGEAIEKLFERFAEGESQVQESRLGKFISNLWKVIKAVGKAIGKILGGVIDLFNGALDNVSENEIIGLIEDGTIIAILFKMFDSVKNFIGIGDSLSGVFDSISETIGSFKKTADVKAFKTIATSLLMLSVAMLVLASIDANAMKDSLRALSAMFLELIGSMMILDGYRTDKNMSKTILKMAASLLILAIACKVLASIDSKEMWPAIGAITVLIAVMSGAMIALSKYGKKSGKSAKALTSMAVAMLILSFAVSKISKIDDAGLFKSLTAITVMFLLIAMLGALTKSVNGSKFKKVSTGMILIAVSMLIFGSALDKISKIDDGALFKALTAMAAVFLEVAMFMALIKKSGSTVSAAISMILLATAMNIMASAVEKFGQLSFEQIVNAIVAIGVVLAEMVLALLFLADEKVLLGAAALLVVAESLTVIADAIEALGKLTVAELAKGFVTIAAVLLVFVGVLIALSAVGPKVLIAAAAITMLSISVLAIGVGLLAAVTALTLFINLCGGMGGVIETLPGLMEAFAIGIVKVLQVLVDNSGLIIDSMSKVVTAKLQVVFKVIKEVIVAFIKMLCEIIVGVLGEVLETIKQVILQVVDLLVSVLPSIFELLTVFFTGLLDMVIELMPRVIEILSLLFNGIMDLLIELTPKIMTWLDELLQGALKLIDDAIVLILPILEDLIVGVLNLIETTVPKLIEVIGVLLDAGIKFIGEYIPKIANLGLDLLTALLDAIATHIEDIVATALLIIENFIRGIADGLPGLIDAGFNLIISFIDGLAEAIENNTGALLDAISRLFWAIIDAAADVLDHAWGTIKEAGKRFMDSGLVQGIKDKIIAVKNAIGDVIQGIKDKIKEKIEDLRNLGKDIVEGLKDGITSMTSSVVEGAKEVGGKIVEKFRNVFDSHSPSRVMAELGKFNMLGLAEGMENYASVAEKSAEGVGKDTIEALGDSMSKVGSILDSGIDLNPTITPILDLSKIQNGGRLLDTMFDSRTVSLAANSYESASAARNASKNDITNAINSAFKKYSSDIINAIYQNSSDTDVNISLSGDANGLFKMIRTQNERYKASTGRSAFN